MSTQKKRKGILIGLGGWGGAWCANFVPYATEQIQKLELVAIVDTNEQILEEARKQLHMEPEQCYTDAKKAFEESRPEVAMLIVPPMIRESMIDLALEYDCDIISEKPLSISMESCIRIYKKVKAAGKKLAVTMTHRFEQDKQSLQREIQSGKYGPISSIHASFTAAENSEGNPTNSWRYKVKHNYAMEGAVHQMDILRSLSGSNCKTIYCKSWAPEWAGQKATAALTLIAEMENGIVCTFTGTGCSASNLNWWNNDRIVAECRDASLVLDHQVIFAHKAIDLDSEISTRVPLHTQKVWGNKWLLEQFLDWVNGGEAPANTIEDNIQLMAMVFSAIESIETGREVKVQEFLKKYMDECQA